MSHDNVVSRALERGFLEERERERERERGGGLGRRKYNVGKWEIED